MDLVLAASVACGVFYRSWRRSLLPVLGMVLAVIWGLGRGGVGGAVLGGLAFAFNLGVVVGSMWWERHRTPLEPG